MRIICLSISLACFAANHSIAGSGLYFGAGAVSQSIDNRTTVTQVFTSPADISVSRGQLGEDFSEAAILIGYKAKRRLTDRFFLAPELQLTRFDDKSLYGTGLRFGTHSEYLSASIVFGISHLSRFDTNPAYYGLGLAWFYNETIALSVRWQRWQTLKESSQSTTTFGAQSLTTTTDTERDIDQWFFGLQFFLPE